VRGEKDRITPGLKEIRKLSCPFGGLVPIRPSHRFTCGCSAIPYLIRSRNVVRDRGMAKTLTYEVNYQLRQRLIPGEFCSQEANFQTRERPFLLILSFSGHSWWSINFGFLLDYRQSVHNPFFGLGKGGSTIQE
jgi:hypothetical protein